MSRRDQNGEKEMRNSEWKAIQERERKMEKEKRENEKKREEEWF